MAFNTKQEDTNYTLMISKVSNGYVLHLLNNDGETVRSAIASEYAVRDYSSYSFCSAVEHLWDYAEKLEKDKVALDAELAANFDTVPTHPSDVTLQQLIADADAAMVAKAAAMEIAEAKESEL